MLFKSALLFYLTASVSAFPALLIKRGPTADEIVIAGDDCNAAFKALNVSIAAFKDLGGVGKVKETGTVLQEKLTAVKDQLLAVDPKPFGAEDSTKIITTAGEIADTADTTLVTVDKAYCRIKKMAFGSIILGEVNKALAGLKDQVNEYKNALLAVLQDADKATAEARLAAILKVYEAIIKVYSGETKRTC